MSSNPRFPLAEYSVPHDILKVRFWREHWGGRGLRNLPTDIQEKFPDLARAIKIHHERGSWHEADMAASSISRLRLEYNYWGESVPSAVPFFIPVYGDPVFWYSEMQESLWNEILSALRSLDGGRAYAKVNELVKHFPQDSRFPLVSLAVHHILTWAIKECIERSRTIPSEVYIVVLSIPEPEFHRLKEKRRFYELRKAFIGKIMSLRLNRYTPFQIGDDLFITLTSDKELDDVLREVGESGIPCDVDVYRYSIEKVETATGRSLRRVKGYEHYVYSFGGMEEWSYAPEEYVKWIRYMDYPYVAWIHVSPYGDLQESSRYFLEWAEKNILSRVARVREEKPISSDIPVCPDLMLTVADGYMEFLDDLAKAVDRRVEPEDLTVVRSFRRSLFLYGLNNPALSIPLYLRILEVESKLHIPVLITVVVAEPKHPFWHIASFFKERGLIVLTGGKMVKLSDTDVRMARNVIPTLEGVTRTTFHNIIRKAKSMGREELKLWIEGLASDEKIEDDTARALCRLIDEIAKNYPGEDERREATVRILRMLAPFTPRRGERW